MFITDFKFLCLIALKLKMKQQKKINYRLKGKCSQENKPPHTGQFAGCRLSRLNLQVEFAGQICRSTLQVRFAD